MKKLIYLLILFPFICFGQQNPIFKTVTSDTSKTNVIRAKTGTLVEFKSDIKLKSGVVFTGSYSKPDSNTHGNPVTFDYFNSHASAASSVTLTGISNWNTAYGWGNHAGLYKPISYVPNWSEITNKPALFDGTWSSLSGKPTFATVASTGSYNDLNNKLVSGTDYQVPLVSGTNIKTLNGSSILGSGDISITTSESDPVVKAITGIVKSNGSTISAASGNDIPNISEIQVTNLVSDLGSKSNKADTNSIGKPITFSFSENRYAKKVNILNFSSLSNKIPFKELNNQINPVHITSNTTITPDTTGALSGAYTICDFIGDSVHKLTISGFNFVNGSSVDTFIFTKNYVSTFAFSKLGKYNYFCQLLNYMPWPDAPVQLMPPGSFTATSASTTQIDLSWTTIANASNYQIYDSIVGVSSSFSLLNSPSQSTTSYNHTGLSSSQHVYYKIRSVGNGTTYLTSSYATANATSGSLTQLDTITSFTVAANGGTQIDLSWNRITHNSGYKIQTSTNGSSFSDLYTNATNVETYSHTGLTAGTKHWYKLKGLGDGVSYSDGNYNSPKNATTFINYAPDEFTNITYNSGTDEYSASGTNWGSYARYTGAFTGDFEIIADINNSTYRGFYIGFNPNNTNQTYTNNYIAAFSVGATSFENFYSYKSGSGTVNTTAVNFGTDTKIKIQRVAGVIAVYTYRSGAWTLIYTFTGTNTSTLYAQINIYSSSYKVHGLIISPL